MTIENEKIRLNTLKTKFYTSEKCFPNLLYVIHFLSVQFQKKRKKSSHDDFSIRVMALLTIHEMYRRSDSEFNVGSE